MEKIDLNTADAATLQRLPGITEEMAKAIIAARPFKSVDDLARVQGVGESTAGILKDQITVGSMDSTLAPTGRTDSSTKKSDSSAKPDSTNKTPSSEPKTDKY